MATVVMKFGGSSVADVPRLREVARLVVDRRRAGDQVVVVVSAMGKTTDSLIAMAREVAPVPPRRELDMLVTAGERISMALLSMAIHEAGGDAISFTGSQSGIITEDQHQGARILEVRPHRVHEALLTGQVVIVAGFQGVSHKREITTLGRGGSDTTAVALAAALQADSCEIYSDVDGVYTADPNVCPQARLLREISYETMQAMASSGAKVLNAQAVEFARKAGIVIHARKTGDESGRETLVSPTATEPSGVVAVVGASAVSWLRGPAIDLAPLLGRLADVGATVVYSVVSAGVDLLVDRTGVPGRDPAVVAGLAREAGLSADDVGLVSLVGAGTGQAAAVQHRAQAVLAAGGIAARGWFAAHHAVAAVVDRPRCDEAVRMLHLALVG
jgi:aspartate kinase